MQVALITGERTVEYLDFDHPEPSPDGVIVDISYCGICGSDVHAYRTGIDYAPALCGHEWVGSLSAVGGDVAGLSEGDRVVVAVPDACGDCEMCRAGHLESCAEAFRVMLGRDTYAPPHGGFAARIPVPAGRVITAEPSLTDEQAAQVEPATIARHAVNRVAPREGDTVVVQGAGPIGLVTLQIARAAGAERVIVVEPDPDRRAVATSVGADLAVDPADSPVELVRAETRGLGADVVYECVGRPHAIQSAVDLARRGGAMGLIGFAEGDASINPGVWLGKEITVSASLGYTRAEFGETMAMIVDGLIDVDSLHTSTIGLAELEPALRRLAEGSPDVKVLVDPR